MQLLGVSIGNFLQKNLYVILQANSCDLLKKYSILSALSKTVRCGINGMIHQRSIDNKKKDESAFQKVPLSNFTAFTLSSYKTK